MSLMLYTNPMSRGRIARWALEETGAPYEVRILQYGPEMKSAEFCAINPMGKIPALSHDGTIVTETPAIVAYLADAFPEARLAPPVNSPLRGPYYRWLFFAAGPLEAATTDRSINVEIPPEKCAFVGYGSMALTLDVLEKAVSTSPYLLGDEFSAADLYLASHLGFGLRFGSIEARPAFQDYIGRTMSRPAAQRANALDDAVMPPAQA
jgi:glutathione S-transferase